MKKLLLALAAITGLGLAALVFQQVFVERSFGPAAMVAVAVLGVLFLSLAGSLYLLRTRFRDAVGKAWLAAFSAVASYLVLDYVAGLILIEPLSPPLVPDDHRHHRLVPNSRAEFHQPDFSYVQRVNNLGLRGQDTTLEKPDGTYRILMLGDSFTMGKGVEDDETFSVLLEHLLQAKLSACGGPRIEVLNAGTDSYAPVLSYIHLKRDLVALDPDLVIENLDASDLIQEAAYRKQAVLGEEGEVVAVPQHESDDTAYEKIRDWTSRNLFFTRALLYYANRSLGHRELTVRQVVIEASPETIAHTLEGDIDRREQWDDIFDSLVRMKRLSEEKGFAFLLTVYPWAHQVSDTEWVPGRFMLMTQGAKPSAVSLNTVKALSATSGIELLDLFPVFKSYQGKESLYFAHDMHWTPDGNALVARGYEEFLAEKLLPHLCAKP
jgi:hypothetical protein